jgi:2-polyprenyl-3-methyl-5-hydroxy-6-metoxy-1,4-benzoquinol methylase
MNRQEHWLAVFQSKSEREVSWYQPRLERSLRLIRDCGVGAGGRVIDVGGGASTLVDDLLDAGPAEITVLDIAESAIGAARARLGSRASCVNWIVGDILTADLPPAHYDLWHDRAVFHFLTSKDERAAYVRKVEASLTAQGHVVIAAFDLSGPTRCSGLDVVRHSEASLRREFGSGFQLVVTESELHRTPSGAQQSFIYCRFRRR